MKISASLIVGVLLLTIGCTQKKEKKLVLHTQEVSLHTITQILPLGDSTARPILYSHLPELDSLPVRQAKQKFIAAVLPAILVAKYRLEKDRQVLMNLIHKPEWSYEDSIFYQLQEARFNTSDTTKLLTRMRTHPNSIILAQAIVESGWGSSRIFQNANNLFGIWSYNRREPRIKATYNRNGQPVYLRKYNDISESIIDYFQTVGRSRPYRRFRKARETSDDVTELLPYLIYYSERREEYVAQLRTIIRQNNLIQYDDYQIDPGFFVEETKDDENSIATDNFYSSILSWMR